MSWEGGGEGKEGGGERGGREGRRKEGGGVGGPLKQAKVKNDAVLFALI